MAAGHATDALVVGAGPVGMLAALALAERGLKVEIVDEEWRSAARSYALALHAKTLELLAGVDRGGDRGGDGPGLADALVERGQRIERIAFFDRDAARATVDLASLGGGYPFVLVLPQKDLEDLLEERLERHGVRVRWNHRLADLQVGDGGPSTATVERLGKESTGYSVATTVWVVEKTEEIAARFVVGADGHRSRVRRALGADFPSLASPEHYAVFEVAPGAAPGGVGPEEEVRVVLGDGTADVLWPLGEGRRRWSFQVGGEALEKPFQDRAGRPDKSRLAVQVGRQSFPYLSREAFGALVAERAAWFDEPEGDLAWSVAVQFERRLAVPLGRDGVWLAGDAAHLGAPIGVHSMNAGLGEAVDLAEAVEEARVGGDAPFPRYERRVREAWNRLQELSEGKGVEVTSAADPWVRDHAGSILASLPASGDHLARLAEQLGLEL